MKPRTALLKLKADLGRIRILFGRLRYRGTHARVPAAPIEDQGRRRNWLPIAAPPGRAAPNATAVAQRVLLAAYQCGPGMGSVSQIGWEWYARLSRRRPVTLVTHIHNRAALELAGAPLSGSEIIFIDTEWFARPLYRIAKRLFPKSEHCVFMLSLLDFFVYEQVALRLLKRRAAAGERFGIVHAATPVTSLAATRLHRLRAPVVLGPLNSGLANPRGFGSILRDDSAWLYRLRGFARIADRIAGSTANAAAILVASQATLDSIPERSRARCLPMLENGVDLRKFHAAPWPEPPLGHLPLRILFVGRLVPFKALGLLLEAIARVRAEFQVRLDVIGDGPMAAVWIADAARLGIAELVNFQGARRLEEVARAMRSAHVLCLPSIRESGGSVLLEAMASARPVIAVAFGGPAEIVDEAVGRIIQPDGPAAVVAGFADAMRDIVRNPGAWRDRGLEGRRRAVSRFSWDVKIDRAIEIYDSFAAPIDDVLLAPASAPWHEAAHG
jgi:glycosyltransferase involved in cell wall biosynthesis